MSLQSANAGCIGGEEVLFGCQTSGAGGEPSDGGIAICGQRADDTEDWIGMRFIHEISGNVDFSYPVDPADGKENFLFHHYFKAGLYHARVRFETGGKSYQVYFDDNPPSSEPDEITGPDAGVRVSGDGKPQEDIACGERPASYFAEILLGTTCDLSNPYGEQACAETAPEFP